MDFFSKFTSNTTAGSGNQHIFTSDGKPHVGRVFYKITAGGKYGYSLLISNLTDSTFGDGFQSHANLICRPWDIHSARIGRCAGGVFGEDISDADGINAAAGDWRNITFGGNSQKHVAPGEFFSTDPITMEFASGDYLCFEMTFSGTLMPYHEESLIPIFEKNDNGWVLNKKMPLPGMVGCDREVVKRIVYLGDSITQGIGTEMNSYTHWNAILAEKIGYGCSHWNMGIGFARAEDTAADGAWLYKAKHSDIVVVCVGTNDTLQNLPEDQIRRDIIRTVDLLASDGRTVVLQTIPPFEYALRHIPVWKRLNNMIKTEFSDKVSLVFDVGNAIGRPIAPHMPIYGGHPNAEGCRIWADKLYLAMCERELV